MAALLYWARYKSFWFGAVLRIATVNGIVGFLLWASDTLMGSRNDTLLLIRGNLPLTIFLASLIALAYAVGRLAVQLDPEEPFANAAVLVLIVMVIVAVTSIAGPVFVAIGEAGLLVLLLLGLRLRRWKGNAFIILKAVLVLSALVLVAGVAAGIATGQILETRISAQAVDGLIRLFVFLIGISLYFIEERRYWRAVPPTPVVVEQLHRACRANDFSEISRWLGDGLVFSQADQRLMASIILPRRLIVDGDVAVLFAPSGDCLFFRVAKGQVAELRSFTSAQPIRSASRP